MQGRVVTPPTYGRIEGPVVYLGGPIDGAPDWQPDAVEHLARLAPECNVANPRRELGPGEELSAEQIDWETGHLLRAAENGVVLFWMAAETSRVPWRVYGMTARAQLFEWKARHELTGTRLVVGIEEGFNGASYIRRRFEQDTRDVPILSSLEQCCAAAASIAATR